MRRCRRRAVEIAAALAAAAVSAVVVRRYRRDIRRARLRVASAGRIGETSAGPIEYAVAGEGPPVLVVHGAGGGFDQGIDIAEPIARSGFRVVAPSRFGYLRTPVPPDASAAAQADAHAALLDSLGIANAAVIGVSAGAPSAMQLALRHPDRVSALALLVPAAYPFQAGRTATGGAPRRISAPAAFALDASLRSDFLFWMALRLARRIVARTVLATPPAAMDVAGAGERARAVRIAEHILPVSARRLGLLNDAAVTGSLPRFELERITAPTLVISLRDDLYGTWEGALYSAEHILGARFVGYPTGGHVFVGRGKQVMEEVVGFLRGQG
jgi:pimeloyl-ACP methyl ester carboxylesterase